MRADLIISTWSGLSSTIRIFDLTVRPIFPSPLPYCEVKCCTLPGFRVHPDPAIMIFYYTFGYCQSYACPFHLYLLKSLEYAEDLFMIRRVYTNPVIFHKKFIVFSQIMAPDLNPWFGLVTYKFNSIGEEIFKDLGHPVSVPPYPWK